MQSRTPKELPTDEEIASWWAKICHPEWKYIFGLMATYGLRNHEALKADVSALSVGGVVIRIPQDTKTGVREVYPYYPEWVDAFNLRIDLRPTYNPKLANRVLGAKVGKAFAHIGLPFQVGLLRHAYGVRMIYFGVEVGIAADYMGHGIEVHVKDYRQWLRGEHRLLAHEQSINRPDRPQAPQPPISFL